MSMTTNYYEPPLNEARADLIRAVNAWCHEHGVYVVAIGCYPLDGRAECQVQRSYADCIWTVCDESVVQLLARLDCWYAGAAP